ncbi:hypothetical protein TREMEDRAFT_56396, partial [Tremella mesenterica DSM 1558]|uniref:uncharacterized protein n=1 Tax=Tremella mesenterica (strain ATCC 24925 / CBS 8224 / DSM 1558 / NBRC 9311 / NRRL Y-6157 / RJB 2259-6 / UBC 559-6) TaxID=578456 RepID=UPI0003F495CF
MTTQPTGSLFASDYTLTVPSSPIPARRPQLHPSSSSKVGLPTPSPERKGLDVVFHADGLALSPGTKHLTASLHSSHSGHSSHVGLITPPISPMSEMPPLSPGAIYSGHSPRHYFPSQLSHLREEENLEEEESDHSRDGEVDPLDVEWAGPSKGSKISGDKYKDY